ncbi:MAG: pseudouridine synthase, partial [Desulfuromonadaceae bacterium]|nr:pseudouridine synthase [Desulfuromonadaceae bacterium]
KIEDAVTLAELETAVGEGTVSSLCLSPMAALGHLPEIPLTSDGLEGLRFGRSPSWNATLLEAPLTYPCGTTVRLTSEGGLVAIATLSPGRDSDIAIVLKRVLV